MVDRPQKDGNKKKKELKKMPHSDTAHGGDSDDTVQEPIEPVLDGVGGDPTDDKPAKKRRRRRRKKKKPEVTEEAQTSDESSIPADDSVSDDSSDIDEDNIVPDEFGDDLPLDDTLNFDDSSSADSTEDAVWDQYDPQNVSDNQGEAPVFDEPSTDVSEPPSPEPERDMTPPVEPPQAPPASPDESDIPDWLKAVPQQDWSAPVESNLPESEPVADVPVQPDVPASEPQPVESFGDFHEQELISESEPPPASAPPPPQPMVSEPPVVEQEEPRVYVNEDQQVAVEAEHSFEHQDVEPETVEGQIVSEMPPQTVTVEDKESFSEVLKSVLTEAGISLKTIVIGIILTVLFIVIGFYLISNIGSWIGGTFDSVPAPSPSISASADSSVKVPVDIPTAEPTFSGETGVVAGEQIGYWFSGGSVHIPSNNPVPVDIPADTGVETGQQLGSESQSTIPEGFQQYVFTLREMQNAFNTDIYELMDKSTDRYTVLMNHINLMKLLEARAQKNMLVLNTESQDISKSFDLVTEQKTAQETLFFSVLRELNPIASEETLNKFIMLGKEQLELKAHYNARRKLSTYYQLLLENVSNRRRDYELNVDALVKGVRVIDVKGSDINLILSE